MRFYKLTQTIETVYQNEFFKPLEPLEFLLEEEQIVLFTIDIFKESNQNRILEENQTSN